MANLLNYLCFSTGTTMSRMMISRQKANAMSLGDRRDHEWR